MIEPQLLSQLRLGQPESKSDIGHMVHSNISMRMRIPLQEELCARELENQPFRGYRAPMDYFTHNVQLLLKRAGGQNELADHSGVSQGTISRWASGGKVRDRAKLQGIADYARVSIEHILTRPLDAPVKELPVQDVVLLPVSLPTEAALTRMFETFLEEQVPVDQVDALAQNLARRLPGGLAHASISPPVPVRGEAQILGEDDLPPAKPRQPRRPEQHT